ncbi:MAG: hypothetical protein AAB431_02075, partial [Patescibacteria group bacterium]
MDFNDYSSPRRTISWKPIAIIAGGIVLAILLVVGAVHFWRTRSAATLAIQTQLQTQRQAAQDVCKDAEDKQACLDGQTQRLALQGGNVELCQDLSGDAYDGCVWEFASGKSDASFCESIKNETNKESCSEGIFLKLAFDSGDVNACDKIKNKTKVSLCKEAVLDPLTAENCLARGKEAKQCEILTVVAEANKKQDMRVCDTLLDERVASCKELVTVDDPDFDGLSSIQETGTYGSDPYKDDTDG